MLNLVKLQNFRSSYEGYHSSRISITRASKTRVVFLIKSAKRNYGNVLVITTESRLHDSCLECGPKARELHVPIGACLCVAEKY